MPLQALHKDYPSRAEKWHLISLQVQQAYMSFFDKSNHQYSKLMPIFTEGHIT